MKFQRHIPNCAEVDPDDLVFKFDTVDQLLSDPWIKACSIAKTNFEYFWIPNEYSWCKVCLLGQWTENECPRWKVIGYLSEIPSELKKWLGGPIDEEKWKEAFINWNQL